MREQCNTFQKGEQAAHYEICMLRDETAALIDDKAATDIRLGKVLSVKDMATTGQRKQRQRSRSPLRQRGRLVANESPKGKPAMAGKLPRGPTSSTPMATIPTQPEWPDSSVPQFHLLGPVTPGMEIKRESLSPMLQHNADGGSGQWSHINTEVWSLLQAQASQIDELQKVVTQPNRSTVCRHIGGNDVEVDSCNKYPRRPAFFEGKDGEVWQEWKRTFLRYLRIGRIEDDYVATTRLGECLRGIALSFYNQLTDEEQDSAALTIVKMDKRFGGENDATKGKVELGKLRLLSHYTAESYCQRFLGAYRRTFPNARIIEEDIDPERVLIFIGYLNCFQAERHLATGNPKTIAKACELLQGWINGHASTRAVAPIKAILNTVNAPLVSEESPYDAHIQIAEQFDLQPYTPVNDSPSRQPSAKQRNRRSLYSDSGAPEINDNKTNNVLQALARMENQFANLMTTPDPGKVVLPDKEDSPQRRQDGRGGRERPQRGPLTSEQKAEAIRRIANWRDKYDLPYYPDKCCWCCGDTRHLLIKCKHLPAAERRRSEQKAAEASTAAKRDNGTQLNR